ncbi:MAG: hypothetical protein RBS55_01680 [Bacteroidales bacterium]|jgi:hypothetical protein|nr:hypothetical protein [Bacteroidales bacterium]
MATTGENYSNKVAVGVILIIPAMLDIIIGLINNYLSMENIEFDYFMEYVLYFLTLREFPISHGLIAIAGALLLFRIKKKD